MARMAGHVADVLRLLRSVQLVGSAAVRLTGREIADAASSCSSLPAISCAAASCSGSWFSGRTWSDAPAEEASSGPSSGRSASDGVEHMNYTSAVPTVNETADVETHPFDAEERSTAEERPTISSTAEERPTISSTAEERPTISSTAEERPTISSTAEGRPTISSTAEERLTTSSTAEGRSTTSSTAEGRPRTALMSEGRHKKPVVSSSAAPVASASLSTAARERRVPAGRLARLMTFGSLAAGLGAGTLAEITRRSLGGRLRSSTPGNSSPAASDPPPLLGASPLLTDANAERIVATLCRVRGAALKLGQLMSIQDSSLIDPRLQRIFERVRQSADFMPRRQMESVMQQQLGVDWRLLFAEFESRPFAAASIGQVHRAVAAANIAGGLDGRPLAVKVQYPGVARGIESDIDNLMSVLNVWSVLPEGLFVDNLVTVAKRELAWECDYRREAVCADRMRSLIEPHSDKFNAPRVVHELSSEQVLTTELMEGGVSLDQCQTMDQETRNHVCLLLMELCIREVFEWRFMQTDPNWSNFLYHADSRTLTLLDFGACRQFDKAFIDVYIEIISGAARQDRDSVLQYSVELGFLTGYESKAMQEAHVDAVMILGEAFQSAEPFDFSGQSTTRRVQRLVPVMLSQRLCPPPEETYSLHRKMSGVFLLCAKLNAKVSCKLIFDKIVQHYRKGPEESPLVQFPPDVPLTA